MTVQHLAGGARDVAQARARASSTSSDELALALVDGGHRAAQLRERPEGVAQDDVVRSRDHHRAQGEEEQDERPSRPPVEVAREDGAAHRAGEHDADVDGDQAQQRGSFPQTTHVPTPPDSVT